MLWRCAVFPYHNYSLFISPSCWNCDVTRNFFDVLDCVLHPFNHHVFRKEKESVKSGSGNSENGPAFAQIGMIKGRQIYCKTLGFVVCMISKDVYAVQILDEENFQIHPMDSQDSKDPYQALDGAAGQPIFKQILFPEYPIHYHDARNSFPAPINQLESPSPLPSISINQLEFQQPPFQTNVN